jgi:hypothetical protein
MNKKCRVQNWGNEAGGKHSNIPRNVRMCGGAVGNQAGSHSDTEARGSLSKRAGIREPVRAPREA